MFLIISIRCSNKYLIVYLNDWGHFYLQQDVGNDDILLSFHIHFCFCLNGWKLPSLEFFIVLAPGDVQLQQKKTNPLVPVIQNLVGRSRSSLDQIIVVTTCQNPSRKTDFKSVFQIFVLTSISSRQRKHKHGCLKLGEWPCQKRTVRLDKIGWEKCIVCLCCK